MSFVFLLLFKLYSKFERVQCVKKSQSSGAGSSEQQGKQIPIQSALQIPNGVSTKLARLVFSYSLILIGLQSELSGR